MFPDEFRVLMDGFRYGAEYHPYVSQLLAEGGGHGNTVEDRVHRHTGQSLLFLQGNAQFFIGSQ